MKMATAIFLSFLAGSILGQTGAGTKQRGVRYTRGKNLDFESLLIEGQLKRPEISVVTGNSGGEDDGLLRLREHFTDQIAMESGEEVP